MGGPSAWCCSSFFLEGSPPALVAEGDWERQHTAAKMAARMPGNGQSGNVAGRMDSVVSHSGDMRRNIGSLMGKGRQRRADRTASFPLNGSLGGGKEAAVFRGVEKSRGQGACGGRTPLSLPSATLRAVHALTRAVESTTQPTSRCGPRRALGSASREHHCPVCVPFLCDSFFFKKKKIIYLTERNHN